MVLNTNVLLSTLVFVVGPLARGCQGWQSGTFAPLVSTFSVQERVHVLAYSNFHLDAAARDEFLVDYLPWTGVVKVPNPPPDVSICRDAFDLPLLHLAAAGKAAFLVTGDRDLLAPASEAASILDFRIVAPPEFLGVTRS